MVSCLVYSILVMQQKTRLKPLMFLVSFVVVVVTSTEPMACV